MLIQEIEPGFWIEGAKGLKVLGNRMLIRGCHHVLRTVSAYDHRSMLFNPKIAICRPGQALFDLACFVIARTSRLRSCFEEGAVDPKPPGAKPQTQKPKP